MAVDNNVDVPFLPPPVISPEFNKLVSQIPSIATKQVVSETTQKESDDTHNEKKFSFGWMVLFVVCLIIIGGVTFWSYQIRDKSPILQGPNECIVLYHIPAASGLLRNILVSTANQYGLRSWNHSPADEVNATRWDIVEVETVQSAKLIHGNFTYGFHEELSTVRDTTNNSCLLLTMLRNPVDRVISDLVHNRHPSNTWKECVGSGNGQCRKYRNDMVRRLSGRISTSSYHNALTMSSSSIVTPSMLEDAKRNIEKFALVGISERLQDTTKILEHVLQWRHLSTKFGDISANTGSVRSVDPDLKRLIEETNQADMELYKYALEIFERRLKEAKSDLGTVQPSSYPRNFLFRNFWLRKPYFYTVAVIVGMMIGAMIGAGWVHVMISRKRARETEKAMRRIAELDSTPVSTPTRRRKYKLTELC